MNKEEIAAMIGELTGDDRRRVLVRLAETDPETLAAGIAWVAEMHAGVAAGRRKGKRRRERARERRIKASKREAAA
jgi:hypothetical protein